MIRIWGVTAAAVMLLAGCASSGGAEDSAPSTTTATSTKTATETVTSKPKTKTATTTATQTVTETVTAAAPAPAQAPAPSAPAATTQAAPAPTSTPPAGNTVVGSDGVTYEVPTTDEGLEGWCSRLEIPEDVRAPSCLGG